MANTKVKVKDKEFDIDETQEWLAYLLEEIRKELRRTN